MFSFWKKWGNNPFDLQLREASIAGKKSFLIAWNRGLGDIALGLYALVYRIREYIPDASITFVTREDLVQGFSLLENVSVIGAEEWKRGVPFDLAKTVDPSLFDVVIEAPDPTAWLRWQLGVLTPRLRWQKEWDALEKKFHLSSKEKYVGVHLHTETAYGYEKNWPLSHWKTLFAHFEAERKHKILLFGHSAEPALTSPHLIDLRGKTTLLEMLSLIKNRCSHLIVPDSGVLSLTYYLDAVFPLKVISLWADPRQGVLKQNVPSPNPELTHFPLLAKKEKIAHITPEKVWAKI